jgi:membrane protease YdiL (CAAX protease family)
MKNKFILGLLLTILGLIGVASILTMDLPIPDEAATILEAQFTPFQIQLLLLINPSILLVIAITVGLLFYQKAGLSVPFLERISGLRKTIDQPLSVVIMGVVGGIIAGALITYIGHIFTPFLPAEFTALGESIKPSIAGRFLYGGITEEILMRFGLMSLLVFLTAKIAGHKKAGIYWIGIIISALLFALGHFPIAFQAVPDPSTLLLVYLIIGNMAGGVIFGWLYWKKGLESAMIAHIFAHSVMLAAEQFIA